MPCLATLVSILDLAVKDRAQLVLENAALRHQLAVLKRTVSRPKIEDSDRMVWIMFRRMLREWKEALIFVKPETVVRWHRKGFAHYWKRRSRSKPGRPPIGMGVIHLIRRMSEENPTWGAPKITDELALLGHEVGETTVVMSLDRRKILHINVTDHPTAAWTARQLLEAFPGDVP